MTEFEVIDMNKNTSVVKDIGKLLDSFEFERANFINLSLNKDSKFNATHYIKPKFEKILCEDEQTALLSSIFEESKNICLEINPNLKLDKYANPIIDISSYDTPATHEFREYHVDGDNYGKCCTLIYYYQVDETVINGGIDIADSTFTEHKIDTHPTEDTIKVLFMNDGVNHCVQSIDGTGKRRVLSVFIGLD